jgi:hypothetical protein
VIIPNLRYGNIQIQSNTYRLDKKNGRTASLGAGGGVPYSRADEMFSAMSAEIVSRLASGETRSSIKYVVQVAPGNYTESVSIPDCSFIRVEMYGANFSGTVERATSTVGYGSDITNRIEFVGADSNRPDYGNISKLSGPLSFLRYNHTQTGISFIGVSVSASVVFSEGINLVYLDHCQVGDGTKSWITTNYADVYFEMVNRSRFVAPITGNYTFYNCNNCEIGGVVTVIPGGNSKFTNMDFSGTWEVTGSTIQLDSESYSLLVGTHLTLHGVSFIYLDKAITTSYTGTIPGAHTVQAALDYLETHVYTIEELLTPGSAEIHYLNIIDIPQLLQTSETWVSTGGFTYQLTDTPEGRVDVIYCQVVYQSLGIDYNIVGRNVTFTPAIPVGKSVTFLYNYLQN